MKRIFVALILLATLKTFSQVITPASLEQMVNTDIPIAQYNSHIATDNTDGYLVVWTTGSNDGSIFGRRYDNTHNPISDEFLINNQSSNNLRLSHWEDGKFIISYLESTTTCKFNVINADNSIGTEITVGTNITEFDLDVHGDTLVCFYGDNLLDSQLYLRGYNLNSNDWINTAVQVSENTSQEYQSPNVVIHNSGRMTLIYNLFILVSGCCNYEMRIMRKTYSANFLAEIPEAYFWNPGYESNVGPDLYATGNNNDEVMITETHGTTSSQRMMRLWILDSNGGFIVNNEFLINDFGADWYSRMETHLFDNGDFIVVKGIRMGGFQNPNQNEAYALFGTNYNASNSGLVQINSTSAGEQDYVNLAVFSNDGFVISWCGNGFQGDTQGVYVRAYNAVAYPGASLQNIQNISISENGTTTQIPVVLNTEPSEDVIVQFTSSDLTEATVDPSQLVFTPLNWNIPQYVTVTPVDDIADDGDITFSITINTSESTDLIYAALPVDTSPITNLDDDATLTPPGDQSFCQSTGMSSVNAIIANNGDPILSVTATSSNSNVVDDNDIIITPIGMNSYSISIQSLDNNNPGTTVITLHADDGTFVYTTSFDVEVGGVNVEINATEEEICEGESVTLAATGAPQIQWNNNVQNNVPFTPTETQTYTVEANDGGICTTESSITIVVNALADEPTIDASSTSICSGEEVTLTATGAINLSWNNGVSNGEAFTPDQTTEYTVSADNGNDCISTSSIVIEVNETPDTPIIFETATEVCSGTEVTLFATGGINVNWNNGIENNVAFTPTTTTTYTVTVDNGTACTNSASIEIIVNETPPTPTITLFGAQLISGSSEGNQWYIDGNIIPTETDQVLIPLQNGVYTVTVTIDGCSATSLPYTYDGIDGVGEIRHSIAIYPNPANDVVFLQDIPAKPAVEIYSATGQLQEAIRFNQSNSSIDISELAPGVYFLNITVDNEIHVLKLIKKE